MIDNTINKACDDCVLSSLTGLCNKEEIELLTKGRKELKFEAGEIIFRQGTFVSQFALLKTGVVKIVLEGKNEKNSILSFIEKNVFIGLPIIGNPETYPFSVRAVIDTELCFIRHEILTKLMDENKQVKKKLLKELSDDYSFLFNRLEVISSRNNYGKIASSLLYLSDNNFKTDILNTISRKELAELSSVSIESLNKILNDLRHEKVIEIEKKKITIIKPDLIRMLSTVG